MEASKAGAEHRFIRLMLHELFQLLIAGDGISAVRLFRSAVSCKVVLLHSFQRF